MKCDDCSEWRWSANHLSVVFHCEDDGQSYTVYVSGEAIADDINSGKPLDVAKEHNEIIRYTAKRLIAKGKYDADGNVVIKSGDIR